MQNRLNYGLAGVVLLVIARVYWPILHANFIWDDWPSFRDLQGDQWLHFVFRDFNQWTIYFRPLVVAFLALQVKLFQGAPGPMHAVSLVLHLLNVTLVGVLAYRVGSITGASRDRQRWVTLICMLLFGLHPALIETVSWIGCQFDLVTTLLILLGLTANAYLQRPLLRAAALSLLFFLAACAKEAGVVFPMLVVLFDIALFARNPDRSISAIVRTLFRRNLAAYVGMVVAALAYLALRHWALNVSGAPKMIGTVIWFAQFQEICLTYLCYLKVIVWPMAGIGPLHPEDVVLFRAATPVSVLTCIAAIGIIVTGLYLAIKRERVLGYIILAVTISVLPVLRIVPVNLDHNLYHERYATLAVAMCCALLPLIRWPGTMALGVAGRAGRLLVPVAIIFWLALCVVDIRTLLPYWQNDIALWRWAMAVDPQSLVAKDNLLLAYERSGRLAEAQAFADELIADPTQCTSCMLHIAKIAVEHGDPARAAAALERASKSSLVRQSRDSRQLYYRELGRLMNLQGRHKEAREVLEASLTLNPKDSLAKDALAKANASLGAASK
jgi:hypothetical protein